MGLLALMSAFVLSSCDKDEPDPVIPDEPDQPTEEVFTTKIYAPVFPETKELLTGAATLTVDGKTTTYNNVAAEWTLVEDKEVRKAMQLDIYPDILIYGKTVESKKEAKLTLKYTLSDETTAKKLNLAFGCYWVTTCGTSVIGDKSRVMLLTDMINTQEARDQTRKSVNDYYDTVLDLRFGE